MNWAQLAPYVIPAIALVAAGLIAKLPQRESAAKMMADQLTLVYDRLDKQDEKIEKLEKRVSKLRSHAFAAREHIRRWEAHACVNDIPQLERPPDIVELFDIE